LLKEAEWVQNVANQERESLSALDLIVGSSKWVKRVRSQIRQIADLDVPVLITGETGTGKELIAEVIHKLSHRRGAPFVPVNTAALPKELVASELFGHEPGAFTGAKEGKPGCFELAGEGILLLDEVGAMPPSVQAVLLRVLDKRTFRRVGGKQRLRSHCRVIATTNTNLERAVEKGLFRRDLLYRLDVYRIECAPLRSRRSDIVCLFEHYLRRFGPKLGCSDPPPLRDDVVQLLTKYGWPGNVRELRNVVRRVLISSGNRPITPRDLPRRVVEPPRGRGLVTIPLGTTIEEAEKMLIERVLDHVHGVKSEAAKVLGISRAGLYKKMRRLNISG